MTSALSLYALAVASLYLTYKAWVRLQLSLAKHPSLRGHSNWSRRVARLIPFFSYDEQEFYASDSAPQAVVQRRRQAIRDTAMVWLFIGLGAVLFRTFHLFKLMGVQSGLVWMTKIITDPFHDIKIYQKAPYYILKGEMYDNMEDWYEDLSPDNRV